jgi:UrcA family protein
MNSRKIACVAAAVFIGTCLTANATNAFAAPPGTVVIEGKRIDLSLQRRVSYADLNVAMTPDQQVLKRRISRTAGDLCFDLNGYYDEPQCRKNAVHSTDDQFAAAVDRAERLMAGMPVGPAVAISMVIGAR